MRRAIVTLGAAFLPLIGMAQPPSPNPPAPPTPGLLTPAPLSPEPADIGVLVRKNGNSFAPLELIRATPQSCFGLFSGAETKLVLPGRHSPVRFATGQTLEFFLRVSIHQDDPRACYLPHRDPTQYSLCRLREEDDERHLTLSDAGFTYTRQVTGKPMLVRLYGQSCFILLPPEPLTPGEYAVVCPHESDDAYELGLFGIDGPPER